MTGPMTPPPPPGPGRDDITPLDPKSPKGREVAARLGATIAALELEVAERRALPAPVRRAA